MAATPKPVRKAVKKFVHTMKKTDLSPKELQKEKNLAKTKFSASSPKYKKTVASDLKKMTSEVKSGLKK